MSDRTVLNRFAAGVLACSLGVSVAVVSSLPPGDVVEGLKVPAGIQGSVPTVDELRAAAQRGPLVAADARSRRSDRGDERRRDVGRADDVVVPGRGGAVAAGRARIDFAGVGGEMRVDVAPAPESFSVDVERRNGSGGLPAGGPVPTVGARFPA